MPPTITAVVEQTLQAFGWSFLSFPPPALYLLVLGRYKPTKVQLEKAPYSYRLSQCGK